MKIRFLVVENSLVRCLRGFILLAGFFYSAFGFSALLCQSSTFGGIYGLYDPSISCTLLNPTRLSTSNYIYMDVQYGAFCDSQEHILTLCSKYKMPDGSSGPTFVDSCPAGFSPDPITRNCVDKRIVCWDGTKAPPGSCPLAPNCSGNPNLVDPGPDGTCTRGDCPLGQHHDPAHPVPYCVDDITPFTCWDGSPSYDWGQSCPPSVHCWDGSQAIDQAHCPVEPTCSETDHITTSGCQPVYCPNGVVIDHSCLDCPFGTHPSTDHTQCVGDLLPPSSNADCNHDEFFDGTSCRFLSCSATQIYSNHTCQACPSGFVADYGHSSCVPGGNNTITLPDGTTVTTAPDGTVTTISPDGTTTITHPGVSPPTTGTPPSTTGGGLPNPTGGSPVPTPTEGPPVPDQTPGVFNGGGTQSGFNMGYLDGQQLVAKSLCYDVFNCSLSFCDKNPLSDSCNGYSGFGFHTTSEYGTVNVSGNCPTYDFDLSIFHSLGTFRLEYHCVLLEQIKPYMDLLNSIVASLAFVMIVLSA